MVKNLKKLRREKGISQQQLASILGISQQSINKYENHNIEPDIETLIALADFFHTSIDYLVGRHNAEKLCTPENNGFTASEEALISDYRKLSATEQTCISTLIRTYRTLSGE